MATASQVLVPGPGNSDPPVGRLSLDSYGGESGVAGEIHCRIVSWAREELANVQHRACQCATGLQSLQLQH